MLVVANALWHGGAGAQEPDVDNLKEMFARLKKCWKSPPLPNGNPGMEITVLVSFKRDGEILGHPRITFESPNATDRERIIYRTAVMETLQRCTPLPFTESMGAAIAGRPLRLKFDDRRNLPKPQEKRAWLTTKIL
ncbi:MAG: hypothetical protein BGP05_21080 [Rhizobiales bacterium 62-47]|nr:hypothetical protein [Hyphomicrobiales bacterium]OJY10191.1 MAG: hypothetical protein BGP05_21080 [Rhizobiales bacterium 62-47]